jgi:thymidylate synthase ThyX
MIVRHPSITAKILADSIPENGGPRLTTFEVVFPYRIQNEFNTHRVFSRNSASSRAVPIQAQINEVDTAPYMPIRAYMAAKGMHSTQECSPVVYAEFIEERTRAKNNAVASARKMATLGLHKQEISDILLPFAWQRVIVSSTEYANFFTQRMAVDAHPAINDLAWAMYEAFQASTPVEVAVGDWHRPYDPGPTYSTEDRNAVAVACCGRVSYNKHPKGALAASAEVVSDSRNFISGLAENRHFSPFEHVAQVMHPDDAHDCISSTPSNFEYPWLQFRKLYAHESGRTA